MAVKREGGHRRVTDNNMWVVISRDMVFYYKEGEFMRLMYAMYLDVLEYYYKFKTTQEGAAEKEIKVDQGIHVAKERRSKSWDDGEGSSRRPVADQEGTAEEHYALFAGNDWYGLKRLQRRKRFDFKRVEKAVNEANDSVIMHSRKKH
ncbi:putative transcription factor & chromatin remodeling ARID family [Helianthus annuus]|nr:putative transcription factor & chromatin remodeling ARID family [Helianthus annuus]